MTDPSLALQAAIISRLRTFAAVTAIVGQRSYDNVPAGATKPYINLGQPQVLPDKAACLDGSEVLYTVHGWSSDEGKSVQIKQLGKAVLDALDEYDIQVSGHRIVVFELVQLQYLDDEDGITKHFAAVFRALTEPA